MPKLCTMPVTLAGSRDIWSTGGPTAAVWSTGGPREAVWSTGGPGEAMHVEYWKY